MTSRFEVGASQIQGQRDYQEDSYAVTDAAGSTDVFTNLNHLIAVVADGVGGEVSGNVASKAASVNFCAALQQNFQYDDLGNRLTNSLQAANSAIAVAVQEEPLYEGMATTLVGAIISKDALTWISVGDSHLFLLRDHSLEKLNADHSLGAYQDAAARCGEISWDEAKTTKGRNMLLSVVDGGLIAHVDLQSEPMPIQTGDRIILASDGLNTLTTQEILSISAAQPSAQEFADSLLQSVHQAGKEHQDNTTVIVVDLVTNDEVKLSSESESSHEGHMRRRTRTRSLLFLLLMISAGLAVYLESDSSSHNDKKTKAPSAEVGVGRAVRETASNPGVKQNTDQKTAPQTAVHTSNTKDASERSEKSAQDAGLIGDLPKQQDADDRKENSTSRDIEEANIKTEPKVVQETPVDTSVAPETTSDADKERIRE